MPKPKEKKDPGFREWVQELAASKVAKIKDPEKKAAFEKVLELAEGDEEAEDVLREAFRGGLREGEFYKRLTGLAELEKGRNVEHEKWKAFRDEVNDKYQAALGERDALKKELEERGEALRKVGLKDEADDIDSRRTKAVTDAGNSVLVRRLEEAEKALKEQNEAILRVSAGAPSFAVEFTKAARKAEKEGFEFDEDEVYRKIVEARGALPVGVAFEDAVRDQRKKRDDEDRAKALAKAKEEGRQEALTQRVAPDALRERLGGVFNSAEKPAEKLSNARSEAQKLIAEFQHPR